MQTTTLIALIGRYWKFILLGFVVLVFGGYVLWTSATKNINGGTDYEKVGNIDTGDGNALQRVSDWWERCSTETESCL